MLAEAILCAFDRPFRTRPPVLRYLSCRQASNINPPEWQPPVAASLRHCLANSGLLSASLAATHISTSQSPSSMQMDLEGTECTWKTRNETASCSMRSLVFNQVVTELNMTCNFSLRNALLPAYIIQMAHLALLLAVGLEFNP